MTLTHVPRAEQVRGEFDGGAILERKPIGFPREGGRLRAVSTLFYWAHAWSPGGGLIDLHEHQGFEIMTFVLTGRVRHFDTVTEAWKTIEEGGAQVIRAGSGISHAERLEPGASIFQIWVDPCLRQALKRPASYSDYPPRAFDLILEAGYAVKAYAGPGGPMTLETPGIVVREYWLEPGTHRLPLAPDQSMVAVLRDGAVDLGDTRLAPEDVAAVHRAEGLPVHAAEPSRFFTVALPTEAPYRTFAALA